ncbi:ABC1 kinase family protein [Nautilia sp.]
MKNNFYKLKRTHEIILILTKYGFGNLVEAIGVSVNYKKKSNYKIKRRERIRKAIEELGPTFIKLAQFLSLRPDLISLELAKELEKLQDSVSPLPFKNMENVLKEELAEKYNDFEKNFELLASASIGQVYKATLKSGEIVAVKILKPGIEEKIYSDISILMDFARILREKFLIYGIDSVKIIEEFAVSIKRELNFNFEALNLKRFASNLKNNSDVKVPKLYEKYCTKRILIMEYIEGIKVSEIEKLKNAGYDLKEIAVKGFNAFCEQIFIHRFFHADPHPGNIWISNGKIVFLDFGIMGRFSEEDARHLMEFFYFVINKKEEDAAICVLKLSKTGDNIDISSFKKEMSDIISMYFYSSLKDLELRAVINDILRIMNRYKVYLKEENYLLAKAVVAIEGVGKRLYPEFNAVKLIKPFIAKHYKKFSFSDFVKQSYILNMEFKELLYNSPKDIKDIINKLKNGKLKIEFEHMGLDDFEKTINSSANRLSIAIIIAAILIGSSMILSAKIPPLIYGVSVFGIAGFAFATIMGIILIFIFMGKDK